MSEDMVERVARAIAYAVSLQSDSGVPPKWSEWRDEARAAIEAMREPTPDMFLAAEKAGISFQTQQRVWPAMIDAALSGAA